MNRITVTRPALWRTCAVALFALALAVPAKAQSVTATDIQRLQDQIYDVSGDVYRVRSTTSDSATRMQSDLDDLRDEVVYLKVKLRKEGSVSRNEYSDLQTRIQDLRSRARGTSASRPGDPNTGGWRTNTDQGGASTSGTRGGYGTGSSTGVSGGVIDDRNRGDQGTASRPSGNSAIPVGQEIDVRLNSELSSETAEVEQRFEATTAADLYRGNDAVIIPAGSTMRGVISSVEKATRTQRKGSITVAFDQITIRGRNYPMRGTVTQALESEGIKGETARIGTGAGIGAIIGGIIGGVKGALLGVLIGGGGTIAATEGKDVKLPAGTILRVRLDQPPAIR